VPPVVSSATGKPVQVLMSIQETALDLGSAGTVTIRTVRLLRPVTDVFWLTVHWAEVQLCPVRMRQYHNFLSYCVDEAVHKFGLTLVTHETPKQEVTTGTRETQRQT
jgi:hypothetical protein